MALAKIKEYFMGGTTTKLERNLIRKLDFFILTFCCMAYFMNYLDRSNVSQAYVSGMKEDLNFKGNQLTVVTTIYSVGYIVGIILNNALLSRYNPRIFFPIMMVIWASLTMCNAAAKRPHHLMVIRLFQGYFESCIFAGTHYILGSWYTEKELGKRSGIFTASGIAGGMFGGFLQSGIYKSMNGLGGLAGWRWLFIIDGIITFPVAAYGFFLFPDTPSTTKAPYFSAEEKELAQARVPAVTSEPILTVQFLKRVVTSWYFYSFGLLWIITNCSEAASSNSLLTLYMKSSPNKTYSVYQLNNYPTGVQAAGIVSTVIWATVTDIFGKRWMAGYYIAITGIVSSAIIIAPSTTEAGIFGAYYWAGTIYACQATFFAWANDTMRDEEDMFRAILIGTMNFGGNLFQVWWPLIFYAADMAPYFTLGMYAMIGVCTCLTVWVSIMIFVERKTKMKQGVIVIDAVADDGSESDHVQALGYREGGKGINKV